MYLNIEAGRLKATIRGKILLGDLVATQVHPKNSWDYCRPPILEYLINSPQGV